VSFGGDRGWGSGFGNWVRLVRFQRGEERAGFTEAEEGFEGTIEDAGGGGLEAVEAVEGVFVVGDGVHVKVLVFGTAFFQVGFFVAAKGHGPGIGLGAGDAAELPTGADGLIDEIDLVAGRLEGIVVLRLEEFEFGGIFTRDDFGLGVDTRFDGVFGGTGASFGGARTGAFEGVSPIGFDLSERRHANVSFPVGAPGRSPAPLTA